MKKYAIFDLDDTLLDFSRGETEGITKIFQENGVTDIAPLMQTYLTINHDIWHQIEQGADRGPLLDTRFARTFATVGLTVDSIALEREYKAMLAHNYYTLPGASDLLSHLKQAGLTIIVATNGTKSVQESRLAGAGITPFFDQIFISEDVGYDKPDQRFFAPIFQAYPALTRANSLMIGDSLRSDILGARNAGLDNVWYNPRHTTNTSAVVPTYEAHAFTDLAQFLLA